MLSHTGGKPFACKKCSYTFSFEEAHEKASFLDIYTRETRSSKENVAPE